MPTRNILSSKKVIQQDVDAVNFVNKIINTAVSEGASDIHIEPVDTGLLVRARVNGVLKIFFEASADVAQSLITRIKVMAEMDVTGKPRPQEGSINFNLGGSSIDLLISVFPTNLGENVVMKILESVNKYSSFEDLGLSVDQAEILNMAVSRTSGLILVTGPAGSGKSTTLYTILNKLNIPEKSLVTLEDPIERKINNVMQSQINPETGLSFSSGLRYQLRQDCDVIMIGEIQDKETAHIAAEAAITGKLVLATIHANDTAGAIVRLQNMGIEPYLIASALKTVSSQRLARINCPHCREEYVPSAELLNRLSGEKDAKYYHSSGCDQCAQSGIVGRVGIHEVLMITERMKELIYKNPSDRELKEDARANGMISLRDITLQRAREGVISAEEALRLVE